MVKHAEIPCLRLDQARLLLVIISEVSRHDACDLTNAELAQLACVHRDITGATIGTLCDLNLLLLESWPIIKGQKIKQQSRNTVILLGEQAQFSLTYPLRISKSVVCGANEIHNAHQMPEEITNYRMSWGNYGRQSSYLHEVVACNEQPTIPHAAWYLIDDGADDALNPICKNLWDENLDSLVADTLSPLHEDPENVLNKPEEFESGSTYTPHSRKRSKQTMAKVCDAPKLTTRALLFALYLSSRANRGKTVASNSDLAQIFNITESEVEPVVKTLLSTQALNCNRDSVWGVGNHGTVRTDLREQLQFGAGVIIEPDNRVNLGRMAHTINPDDVVGLFKQLYCKSGSVPTTTTSGGDSANSITSDAKEPTGAVDASSSGCDTDPPETESMAPVHVPDPSMTKQAKLTAELVDPNWATALFTSLPHPLLESDGSIAQGKLVTEIQRIWVVAADSISHQTVNNSLHDAAKTVGCCFREVQNGRFVYFVLAPVETAPEATKPLPETTQPAAETEVTDQASGSTSGAVTDDVSEAPDQALFSDHVSSRHVIETPDHRTVMFPQPEPGKQDGAKQPSEQTPPITSTEATAAQNADHETTAQDLATWPNNDIDVTASTMQRLVSLKVMFDAPETIEAKMAAIELQAEQLLLAKEYGRVLLKCQLGGARVDDLTRQIEQLQTELKARTAELEQTRLNDREEAILSSEKHRLAYAAVQ